jgi:hypothetical protein
MPESPATPLTPNALAEKLAGAENRERIGKTVVRPLLRRYFTRDTTLKGSNWILSDAQIAFVTAAYNARKKGEAFDADAMLLTIAKQVAELEAAQKDGK